MKSSKIVKNDNSKLNSSTNIKSFTLENDIFLNELVKHNLDNKFKKSHYDKYNPNKNRGDTLIYEIPSDDNIHNSGNASININSKSKRELNLKTRIKTCEPEHANETKKRKKSVMFSVDMQKIKTKRKPEEYYHKMKRMGTYCHDRMYSATNTNSFANVHKELDDLDKHVDTRYAHYEDNFLKVNIQNEFASYLNAAKSMRIDDKLMREEMKHKYGVLDEKDFVQVMLTDEALQKYYNKTFEQTDAQTQHQQQNQNQKTESTLDLKHFLQEFIRSRKRQNVNKVIFGNLKNKLFNPTKKITVEDINKKSLIEATMEYTHLNNNFNKMIESDYFKDLFVKTQIMHYKPLDTDIEVE